jgi:hypothetical protein
VVAVTCRRSADGENRPDRSRAVAICEGEADVWDPRRRAQQCGRGARAFNGVRGFPPCPETTRFKIGATAHGGKRDPAAVAGGREKAGPCGSSRAPEGIAKPSPGGCQGERATSRRFWGAVLARLEIDRRFRSTISSRSEPQIDLGPMKKSPDL